MAERDRILERERRQMEQILELDMEELQVEEVDDDGSSSSSDVDTFLRNTHEDGGINTSEELMVDTSTVSLQDHTYLDSMHEQSGYLLEAKIDGARGKFAFLDGDRVLNLPMFYLQGVVLFPEASLHLRVFQPRLAEAIDKAINHVDAPCMIGVVYVYRHTNDGHYTIASVGTMAEIQKIQQLDDGSSCVLSHGQQRFRLMRHWLDVDGVPWGEVQIIEEDTPQRTPRDAFGQLAATNSSRQCASSIMPSLHASCSTELDHVDSDMDRDSLSPTSTSSDYSVTDKRINLLGSRSSGLARCDIVDKSSNEGQNSIPEQSCRSHESVKEIDGYGQPDKNTNTGDDNNLCFVSSKSFQRAKKKDTKQQKHYSATKNASQAPLSFWPRWAYEMYDSYSLSRRAADLWRQVILNPSMDDHVKKPNYLSFCIGSKLPISESLRQELLEIDGISYRLQREIQLLKAVNIIRCKNCLTHIARRSDMVVTSSDSPMSSHSNQPHSFVKEVITVYSATGLALRGDPSKTHSWFPEYTWTIALCSACQSNIGWLFRADNEDMHPRSFWAIRTSQISDDTQSR